MITLRLNPQALIALLPKPIPNNRGFRSLFLLHRRTQKTIYMTLPRLEGHQRYGQNGRRGFYVPQTKAHMDSSNILTCPFCSPATKVLAENASAVALLDSFPISPGHALVVPRQHVACFFDLSEEEQLAVWSLVAEVRADLQKRHQPDGFNIGLNDGTAAGQTVLHAHIHIVPRYTGDVADPRGGVRWVIPAKADYWSKD